MGTSVDLTEMEEALKLKYKDIITQMSHLELKKFQKSEYQNLTLQDLQQANPGYKNQKQLEELAQCIANFLFREANAQLKKRSRDSTSGSVATLLSKTVLSDLENTFVENIFDVASNQTAIDHCHSDDDDNNSSEQNSTAEETYIIDDTQIQESNISTSPNKTEPSQTLNDSITLLKQVAAQNDKSKASEGNKKSLKCCDTCKIKPKSKKTYDQIQCSLCMSWFHEMCVGIESDQPVGLWLCLTCREIPNGLQNEITNIKTGIQELQSTTKLILSAVQDLSTKIENNIGGLNDKIAALSKQVKSNDKSLNDAVQNVQNETNNVKKMVEQKSCQIINKSITILNKLKTQTETNTQTQPNSNDTPVQRASQASKPTANSEANKHTRESLQRRQSPMKQKQKSKPQKPKPSTQKQSKSTQQEDREEEKIDLTQEEPTPAFSTVKRAKKINQSTLIIGSSLLKNVKVNDLNNSTAVRTFPGATIDTIKTKLAEFNLDDCKTVILMVGGNDADNGTDLETFTEKYEELLTSLLENDHTVVVSGLIPRATVDLSPYNNKLQQLCESYDMDFVNSYDSFLLASGELPESYYTKDKVHINSYGTKKLLANIDRVHRVTRQGQSNVTTSLPGMYQPNSFQRKRNLGSGKGYRHASNFCHICQRRGHSTQDCWFNGRSDCWSGWQSR